MRLLFINSIEKIMRGAEHFTLTLARALTARGHAVTIDAYERLSEREAA